MNTVEFRVHFSNGAKGRKRMRPGTKPEPPVEAPVPRAARLMALAIHFDGLIRNGVVEDYADLARLGGVSRARISQIMDLLNLAPDIQEQILFLPRTEAGRDSVSEKQLRSIVAVGDWKLQRDLGGRLLNERPPSQ